ncbi:alpha/beta hydrolase [Burkholderia sp. JPY481]
MNALFFSAGARAATVLVFAALLGNGASRASDAYTGDTAVTHIVELREQSLVGAHDFLTRRASFETFMRQWPEPNGVSVEEVSANGVPGKWISPRIPARPSGRVILYLHGGGFYSGSSSSHRLLAAELARDAHANVLVIDYRRMPEARYPAQIEDAMAAYRWLLSRGYGGPDIALAGESVGGNLVVELALRLRDSRQSMPASLVVMSPVLDLTASGESITANANRDPLLQRSSLLAVAEEYLHGVSPDDPEVSPLFADLHGLPPVLVQVGAEEILLDDSIRFARLAAIDEVSVTLEVWPGVVHQWQLFPVNLADARRALEHGGRFIDASFGKNAARPITYTRTRSRHR